ncbi:hypothetical protein [Pedobacter sp. UYP1]
MIIYKGWGPLALLIPVATILIGIFFLARMEMQDLNFSFTVFYVQLLWFL